jgi:predicted AlkP superfamily phosphohydrolase/phosphomutase
MSDHGGGPHPERFFHTNAWLRAGGWLSLNRARPGFASRAKRQALAWVRARLPFEERLRRLLPARIVHRARQVSLNIADVDWSQTRAYRFNMYHPAEGIAINLKGRQPQGIVSPGAEYDSLVADIMAALRQATDPETGRPIVAEVYRRDEIYDGPYLEIAPDIVLVLGPGHKAGVESSGASTAAAPLGGLPRDLSGVHTMDGILIARGPGIQQGIEIENSQIADLAPTILHLAGQPVPPTMDGRVLGELFTPDDLARRPISYSAESRLQVGDESSVSDQDDRAMRDKLRGLGYID